MSKRKGIKRRQALFYLPAFDSQTDDLVGHVVDITIEGIKLVSPDPIETDADFHLRLELPRSIRGRRAIVCDAHSVWCRKDINPDFFDTGLQLHNIDSENIAVIEGYIDEYGFRD